MYFRTNLVIFSFKLGVTPYKAEQSLRGMEVEEILKEKSTNLQSQIFVQKAF